MYLIFQTNKKMIVMLLTCMFTLCSSGQSSKDKEAKAQEPILDSEVASHAALAKTFKYYEGDTVITVNKPNENFDYLEKTIYPNSNFRKTAVYDKQSLKLKVVGMTFIDMPVGKFTIYGQDTEIINTIDYDEKYPVSIDNVLSILNSELKLDLNRKVKGLYMSREMNMTKQIPVYDIYIPQGESEIQVRHIEVDGVSGKIMQDKIEIIMEY